jgi:hypothetical protein
MKLIAKTIPWPAQNSAHCNEKEFGKNGMLHLCLVATTQQLLFVIRM